MTISFTFNITPKSKDNVKAFNKSGRAYLPKEYQQYEEDLSLMALMQMRECGFEKPIDKDLFVTKLNFYFPYKPTNVDFFNFTKSIFDALQGIVYKNDNQILGFIGTGGKLYDKENPRIEIEFATPD